MHDGGRVLHGLAAVVTAAALLCSCGGTPADGPTQELDVLVLEDESPTPAPHSLVRLQEQPTFPRDDNQRQYAMREDFQDRHRASEEPLTLEETESKAH